MAKLEVIEELLDAFIKIIFLNVRLHRIQANFLENYERQRKIYLKLFERQHVEQGSSTRGPPAALG